MLEAHLSSLERDRFYRDTEFDKQHRYNKPIPSDKPFHRCIFGDPDPELKYWSRKPVGKARLGIWFSAKKEVAETYGGGWRYCLIERCLDVTNPFDLRRPLDSEMLTIAEQLGDEKFINQFWKDYGKDQVVRLDKPFTFNRWIDNFGYERLKEAFRAAGYDALINPSGETRSGWGPSALEVCVFSEDQIRECDSGGYDDEPLS